MARKRTPTTDPRKVIGYVRVSTDEQTLGPEAQRAALLRWCDQHGAELVAVHADLGISGGAALDKRPALLAALAALKEHAAGVLLVAKRDRLARDTMVAAMVERLAERDGATICTADGTNDGDGPEAVLMRRIVDAFAEYERLLIKARTRAALAVKKSRGERVSREPGYGYRLAADGKTLEAHPAEQQTVACVRMHRAAGMTLRQIGAELTAAGMTPRNGGCWNPRTLWSIARAA
jgi:DNA invertase Pin-like site-specific DNA recombinase